MLFHQVLLWLYISIGKMAIKVIGEGKDPNLQRVWDLVSVLKREYILSSYNVGKMADVQL